MSETLNFSEMFEWIQDPKNKTIMTSAFDATSRFARLQAVTPWVVGRNLYLRLEATTGDAMGMNMVAKGTEAVLERLKTINPDLEVIAISGNVCVDKKPSAMNWLVPSLHRACVIEGLNTHYRHSLEKFKNKIREK